MEMETIAAQNPWWKNTAWAEEDRDLKRLKNYPFVFERKQYIPLKKGVTIVYGPRQVGKTTWLKKTIQEKIGQFKPTEIFFLNAETAKDRFELLDAIKTVLDLYEPKIVFIDEISSIQDWEKTIKTLVDTGAFEEKKVLLTGSNSLNILKKTERLPGRLAEGKNKYRFYPLCFREIAALYGIKPKNFSEAIADLNRLNKALLKYFLHGGFIRAMNALEKQGCLEEELFSIYAAWIDGELAKAKKSPELATFILDSIANSLSNETSWSSLSKQASHPTIADYAETLKNMQVIDYLKKSKRTLTGNPKSKKIYFTDPFLYWLVLFKSRKIGKAELADIDSATAGKLAELSAFTNLAQYLDAQYSENDFDIQRHLRFDKQQKNETDFVVRFGKKILKIESKFGKIEKEKKGTVYLTKNTLEKNKLPLAAFLLFPEEITSFAPQ